MRRSVFWAILACSLLLAAGPVRAAHLQGEAVARGTPAPSDGEFYAAGEPLQALYRRLLEADALTEQITSLERTLALQEAELAQFRERRGLTETQREDFERLKASYELHLGIYRDALQVYRTAVTDLTQQVVTLLAVQQALAGEIKALHLELRWTRGLSIFGILGALISAMVFR